jgi:F-type H+-transporting ATPase subunit epsilon
MAESTKPFRLQVVTPDRTVYDESVVSVTVPAEGGRLGILANHAPLIAVLDIGEVDIVEADGDKRMLMTGHGFLEVKDNHVRILARVGERDDEIDLERAESAEKRARERLKAQRGTGVDLARAEAARARAVVREKIARDIGGGRRGKGPRAPGH